MYYITSYNRFGGKYTSEKEEKPRLLGNPNLDLHLLPFCNTPHLTTEERQYQTFRIPKASGGFREINAPHWRLKERQRELVKHMQEHLHILESPWAFAYTKGLSALAALKKHQENQSKWFLKIDIKNFFPSCTISTVENNLSQIFPICSWISSNKELLFSILREHVYHNGCLPQGGVTSPYLSNLIMTPYDYQIHKLLKTAAGFKKQKYIYTRYADDILISAKNKFEWQTIANLIQNIFGTTFELKTEKTRYGSSSGRNWNLGAMLNTENNITIGYRAKEEWKRKMMETIIKHTNNEPISLAEKQNLSGVLAYYKSIEPDYFVYLNKHYFEKYNQNFEQIIKPIY